jgi:nucleotide-binding universal stress UspA family protein
MWGAPALMANDYSWEDKAASDLLATAKIEVTAGHSDLDVETVAVNGGPASVLVEESTTASLVVVATRARGGLLGHLAGSVAAQVASHASAPVVVLRPTDGVPTDPTDFAGRPILVGLDGSEESEKAMAFAVDEAVARGVGVRAVYAWNVLDVHNIGSIVPDTYAVNGERDKAERLITEAVAGWSARYPDLGIAAEPVHDLEPLDALVREGAGAGLTVVGSRGHGGFMGLRLGSTVDGLIRYAVTPVAVVRGDYPGRR